MLTTAFDISNDESDDHGFMVIAGFLGYAEHWREFDVKWRARLAQDGIEYFHMNRFAHSTEMFAGWNTQEPRRRKLMADLLDIIQYYPRECRPKIWCGC